MKKKSIYVSEKLLNDLKIISKNSNVRISDLVESLIVDGLNRLDSINISLIKKGSSFSSKKEDVLDKYDSDKDDSDVFGSEEYEFKDQKVEDIVWNQ